MIKILLIIFILTSSFYLLSSNVYAQGRDAGAIIPNNDAPRVSENIAFYNNQLGTGLNANLNLTLILSHLLPFILIFAGLILFAMLIMGGFEMMTAAGDAKKADGGKTRITQAIVGFIIIFASYWIVQIMEIILGVNILR